MRESKQLFVTYSYDEIGPFILFEDLDQRKQWKQYFDSKSLTIQLTDERRCVGTFDLATFNTYSCPNHSILEKSNKGERCSVCQYKVGFNPAFYNAESISPHQKKYNETPHVVYLAYFSPLHIKVGIASEKRQTIRLLEQGARAAIVLERFSDAYKARGLEKRLLTSRDGLLERLTSNTKYNLLVDEVFSFHNAYSKLEEVVKTHYGTTTDGEIIDLSKHYFYGKSENMPTDMFRITDNVTVITGRLVGMIGENIIVAQKEATGDVFLPIPVKKWASHLVSLSQNSSEVRYSYDSKQMALW